jgi:hypothetical protein
MDNFNLMQGLNLKLLSFESPYTLTDYHVSVNAGYAATVVSGLAPTEDDHQSHIMWIA